MRFTGSTDAKVDEKGRVFVPSNFRKILQKEEVDGLILRRDIFQRCLVLFPINVWDAQVDAITARTNIFSREGRDALRKFVAGAENRTIVKLNHLHLILAQNCAVHTDLAAFVLNDAQLFIFELFHHFKHKGGFAGT